MLVVNFKAYSEAAGKKAEDISRLLAKVKRETGKEIVVAPQSVDLQRLKDTEIPVYAQHIDPVEPGSHTGSVLPETAKEAGASGTLLNHSEKRLEENVIENAVGRARELSLTSIVCARNPDEVESYSGFNPDYVAFEPPELIGGEISVSRAEPELIQEAVERSSVPVLAGAGIKTREDVEKSLELGTEGVLVASGIVKSETPGKKARELCRGL